MALFGCAPKRPLDYLGSAGLVWAINGGRLVELHRNWAVIELAANGSRHVFERRRVDAGKVTLPWIGHGRRPGGRVIARSKNPTREGGGVLEVDLYVNQRVNRRARYDRRSVPKKFTPFHDNRRRTPPWTPLGLPMSHELVMFRPPMRGGYRGGG
jgi:hypothetical protein